MQNPRGLQGLIILNQSQHRLITRHTEQVQPIIEVQVKAVRPEHTDLHLLQNRAVIQRVRHHAVQVVATEVVEVAEAAGHHTPEDHPEVQVGRVQVGQEVQAVDPDHQVADKYLDCNISNNL